MPTKTLPTLDYGQRGHSNWLEALDNACREWGCFQLCNHSLDDALCTAMLAEMERFFALPPEDKLALERSADNPWGFYDRELTKNVPDWKQIFDVGPASTRGPFGAANTPWPEQLPKFRSTVEAFYAASQSLALTLLADIGECLGVLGGCHRAHEDQALASRRDARIEPRREDDRQGDGQAVHDDEVQRAGQPHGLARR